MTQERRIVAELKSAISDYEDELHDILDALIEASSIPSERAVNKEFLAAKAKHLHLVLRRNVRVLRRW